MNRTITRTAVAATALALVGAGGLALPAHAADETLSPAEIEQALNAPESGLVDVSPGAEDPAARTGYRPSYWLRTKGAADPGYADARGTFQFRREGTAFRTVGNVNDACPGNGKGAYLYAFVKFENGAVGRRLIRRDTGGCEGPGVKYDVTLGSGTRLKIRKAVIMLVEKDAGSRPVAHAEKVYVR